MNDSNRVLDIKNFSLSFLLKGKISYAVDNIDLHLEKGEIIALVGESSSGKTQTALSCMGLQPKNAIPSGSIKILGEDVLNFSKKQWNSFRGKNVSMIFQEPMTSLNPLEKIGKQIAETGILHGMNPKNAKEEALRLMTEVNLTDVHSLYDFYPHQLSGGQRQRVMIASALMNNPSIIIADEMTTALDVTTQSQILNLLKDLNKKSNTSIFLITHDLLLVKKFCTRVYIMYAGVILESGYTEDILQNPIHPYTKALLGAIPTETYEDKKLFVLPGCIPTIDKRDGNHAYLSDRWLSYKDICYRNVKSGNTDKKVNCEDNMCNAENSVKPHIKYENYDNNCIESNEVCKNNECTRNRHKVFCHLHDALEEV